MVTILGRIGEIHLPHFYSLHWLRNADVKRLNADDLSMSDRNMVNFGPVTAESEVRMCTSVVNPYSGFSVLFRGGRHCYTRRVTR